MGALITFMKGVKKAFTNEKGKIQIFPKPDLSLAILVALIFCWFYFDLNNWQQLLVVSFSIGMMTTWSLRHIVLRETPFFSYFAWVTLILAIGSLAYIITQLSPALSDFS
jgi:hypothetical protein